MDHSTGRFLISIRRGTAAKDMLETLHSTMGIILGE
jgi:hypothetical protein